MCREVKGTLLTGNVVVADHIAAIQSADFAQPSGQFYKRLIARICELAGLVRVADFNGNSILVPVVAG